MGPIVRGRLVVALVLVATGLTVAPAGAEGATPLVTRIDPGVGSAFGGTMVSITGTGLAAATKVRFGPAEAASFQVIDDGHIRAESPPQPPGPVQVTVSTATAGGAEVTSPTGPASEFHYFEGVGWVPTDPLPRPRDSHIATALADGKVVVIGGNVAPGFGSHGALTDALVYDPRATNAAGSAGSWRRAAASLTRTGHSATLVSTGPSSAAKVVVAGGVDAAGHLVANTELFDPTSDTWSATGPMAVPRSGHTATLLSTGPSAGKVLVAGGADGAGNLVATAELYDPTSGTWSETAPMAVGRTGHTATALADGKVLVAGGRDGFDTALDSTEVYDPGAIDGVASWSLGPTMSGARFAHTATALAEGRVVVAGGQDDRVLLATAEVYEPVGGGTWRATGAMRGARRSHTATALADGKVLVAGGEGPVPLASAELYDPATSAGGRLGAWSPAASMRTARRRHSATALADGRVLVAGGDVEGATAEAYDPSPVRPPPAVTGIRASSGPTTGTTVTITGTFLRGATAVSFGRLAASSFRVVSNNAIEAVSPPQAVGHVDVKVTTPAGTSRPTVASRFFYGAGAWGAAGLLPPCASKPCPTHQAAATALGDGRVLVAFADASAAVYDPASRTWARTPPMKAARATSRPNSRPSPLRFTATRLGDGRVLVAGGCCQGALNFKPYVPDGLLSAEIYDPKDNSWLPTGSMATPRQGHTATLLATGEVLVTGGGADSDPAKLSSSAEIFDPDAKDPDTGAMGAWRHAGTMTHVRVYATASLLPSGQVLVAGGAGHAVADGCEVFCHEPPLASVEIYTPGPEGSPGTWSPGADMSAVRLLHTATGLAGGRILVAGSESGGAGAELYDPGSGTWTTTGPMTVQRSRHTATLLAGGTVLVAGGNTPRAGASAELFDPASGTWSPTTSMGEGRFNHTAALVDPDAPICRRGGAAPGEVPAACGTVVVTGGLTPGDEDTPVTSAEAYSPAPHIDRLAPARGPSAGGGPVVLAGSGFAGAQALSFGDVVVTTTPCPASAVPAGCFTVDSPTRITAVSPPHPKGAVPVGVTGPGGISGLVTAPGPAQHFSYEVSRPPMRVADLAARAESTSEITLSFTAPSADGPFAPPARDYVVKQSAAPIIDQASFDAATSLCEAGVCRFEERAVAAPGQSLSLSVADLKPASTYHYALRALNEVGLAGPISNPARATTVDLAVTAAAPAPASSTTTPSPPTTGAPSRGAAPLAVVPVTGPRLAPANAAAAAAPPPVTPAAPAGVVPANAVATPAPPAARVEPVFAAPEAQPSSYPRWLVMLLGAAVMVGLGILGAFLNRRYRT